MKAPSFVIIGCGAIGKRHAAIIHSRYRLKALCDTDPEKVNTLANLYGCSAYNNINELLSQEDDIDVAVICTPNGLHAEHSIAALNAGLHVLCEKPMAIRVTDCMRMIEASEIHRKHLLVVKQNRYNPPVQAMKQLLMNKGLGKIIGFQVNGFWNGNEAYYTQTWKGSLLLDGGILYTQFSHFIDILIWFLEDVEIEQVLAGNLNHQKLIEIEDTLCALAKTKTGALGTMHFTVNASDKNMEGSITLFGEKGTVKIGGEYLNTIAYWQVDGVQPPVLEKGNLPNQYETYVGSMSNHPLVYDHFTDVLYHHAAPSPNATDAMKSVQLIESMYNKLKSI